MTAKLTAQAGTGGFRRTFVDRNRIAKITDRRFPLGATALARFRATRKHAGMQGVGSGTWAFAASLALVTFALDPTLAISSAASRSCSTSRARCRSSVGGRGQTMA